MMAFFSVNSTYEPSQTVSSPGVHCTDNRQRRALWEGDRPSQGTTRAALE